MPTIGSGTGEEKVETKQGLTAFENAKPLGPGAERGQGGGGTGPDITASRTTPIGGKK